MCSVYLRGMHALNGKALKTHTQPSPAGRRCPETRHVTKRHSQWTKNASLLPYVLAQPAELHPIYRDFDAVFWGLLYTTLWQDAGWQKVRTCTLHGMQNKPSSEARLTLDASRLWLLVAARGGVEGAVGCSTVSARLPPLPMNPSDDWRCSECHRISLRAAARRVDDDGPGASRTWRGI